MIKNITSILLAICLAGCANFSVFSKDPVVQQARDAMLLELLNQLPSATSKIMAGNYAQAFGDALRSLEGTEVSLIPAQIQALRAKWLPKGDVYSQFAASMLTIYLAQHPVNQADAQKVLEAIALGLQTK